MSELASAYDEDNADDTLGLLCYLDHNRVWVELKNATTKQMQLTLKVAMKKVENQNFDLRLGVVGYDPTQLAQFRESCKNVKLRHTYFRLVSRDFYTKDRMFRFGMSRNDQCERCGEVETYKHLFWECDESRRVWRAFYEYMGTIGSLHRVSGYEDVLNIDGSGVISMIKVRVIQAMIQVVRPIGWNVDRVRKLALEIKCIELYNCVVYHKNALKKTRWEPIK